MYRVQSAQWNWHKLSVAVSHPLTSFEIMWYSSTNFFLVRNKGKKDQFQNFKYDENDRALNALSAYFVCVFRFHFSHSVLVAASAQLRN